MKLKRIFMTGILASSMLALAACGDDTEPTKPAEETPVEDGNKDKEKDKENPVDPVEPEDDSFTLKKAVDLLKNFDATDYVDELIAKYKGDNSYILGTQTGVDYDYKTENNVEVKTEKPYNSKVIFTLDDATKVYGISKKGEKIEYAYSNIDGIISEVSVKDANNRSHNTYPFIEVDDEDGARGMIASLINETVFKGNVFTALSNLAENIDTYKNPAIDKILEYVDLDKTGVDIIKTDKIKSEITEKTSGVLNVQTILSLLAPVMTEFKGDTATLHAENPYAFIRFEYDKDTKNIRLSLDQDLLSLVLTENKNKTLEELFASIYETTVDEIDAVLFGSNTAIIYNTISSLLKMDAKSMLKGIINKKIDDDLIEILSGLVLEFETPLALDGSVTKLQCKLGFTLTITDQDDPTKTQVMPIGLYFAYNNGEVALLAGLNQSNEAVETNTYGIKDSLFNKFIGTIVPNFAQITYTIDETDTNKSVLYVEAMNSIYKATITQGEGTFNVEIGEPELDDNNHIKYDGDNIIFEKVGEIAYVNTNEEQSLHAYYHEMKLDYEENAIYFGYYSHDEDYGSVYNTIDIKFNDGDDIFKVTSVLNDKNPDTATEASPVKVYETNEIGVRVVESGYEFYTTIDSEDYYNSRRIGVTKTAASESDVYTIYDIDYSDNKEDYIEVLNEFYVIDSEAKSFGLKRYRDVESYKIENNVKETIGSVTESDLREYVVSVNTETGQLIFDSVRNDSKGRISDTSTWVLEHKNDTEKDAIIDEINGLLTQYGKYTLTIDETTLNELNANNAKYNTVYDKFDMSVTELKIDTYAIEQNGDVTYSGLIQKATSIESQYTNLPSQVAQTLYIYINYNVSGKLDFSEYKLSNKNINVGFETMVADKIEATTRLYEGSNVYDVKVSGDTVTVIDYYHPNDTVEITSLSTGVQEEVGRIKEAVDDYVEEFKLDNLASVDLKVVPDVA